MGGGHVEDGALSGSGFIVGDWGLTQTWTVEGFAPKGETARRERLRVLRKPAFKVSEGMQP